MIHRITPDDLTPSLLQTRFYPDLTRTAFWSESFDPSFYIALAESGFISISTTSPSGCPILLAELQSRYAVLDWKNLHGSRHLQKLIRSGRLEKDEIELRVAGDPRPVIDRLLDHHCDETWMTEPYLELLRRLPTTDVLGFALHGIELWSIKHNRLVAGELGYTIGRTYTSLSGFHTRDTPMNREWRHFGTLEMWLLANRLKERGYAFWNLGHPYQPYKRAFGARILPRKLFLKRWLAAQSVRTGQSLR